MPRRFFPLSNAPLPTRSPYGVNDNHDSPPRATRRPLSFNAITRRSPDHRGYQRLPPLPRSFFPLSLSLSSSHDTDYVERESTKLEEEENGMKYIVDLDEIGVFFLFIIIFSFYRVIRMENEF